MFSVCSVGKYATYFVNNYFFVFVQTFSPHTLMQKKNFVYHLDYMPLFIYIYLLHLFLGTYFFPTDMPLNAFHFYL